MGKPAKAAAPAHTPERGDTVRSTRTGQIGTVMDFMQGKWFVRPLGGGREFSVHPDDLAPADQEEILRAKVALANRWSREGRP
jgi:hypothetical protein